MELVYEYNGFLRSVESIMTFTKPGETSFWSDVVFHFFDLDKEKYNQMGEEERRIYLTDYFGEFEANNRMILEDKVKKYNEKWKICKPQIVAALEDAFEVDLTDQFNSMKAFVTFNPVSPRYLENNSFDIFYLNSEKGAIGVSIHEIIHFVWFYVWNQYFYDNIEEYERPHLKWILSEMVVEPIMRDERLRTINPYFDENAGGCVYPYFYTLKIEGESILEILNNMYTSMSMRAFMEASYQFCIVHEAEIRRHIEENEN